jgi:hypothetical protein
MTKLRTIQLRWLYRIDGELQTKIEVYRRQADSLSKFRTYGRRLAAENDWRFLDAIELDDEGNAL